jgi:hypothetical protein
VQVFIDEMLDDFVMFNAPGLEQVLAIKQAVQLSMYMTSSSANPASDSRWDVRAETALVEDGFALLDPHDLRLNMRGLLVVCHVSQIYRSMRNQIFDFEAVFF